jgi:hypothetical protein
VELSPLVYAIRFFSNSECSELRDKIFGLLRMVYPLERLAVDYDRPVRDLSYGALTIAMYSDLLELLPSLFVEYTSLALFKGVAKIYNHIMENDTQPERWSIEKIC